MTNEDKWNNKESENYIMKEDSVRNKEVGDFLVLGCNREMLRKKDK